MRVLARRGKGGGRGAAGRSRTIGAAPWLSGVTGLALATLATVAGCSAQNGPEVPIVGLPCEGCEAVFVGMPERLTSTARLADAGEAGERMRIQGTVRNARGDAVPGVIVYVYHTDDRGIYPRDSSMRGGPAHRHGRLRGWARTDDQGRYRFETIRPAGYPDVAEPAHVHVHVIEPERCTYYLTSIRFSDDARLSAEELGEARSGGRGGPGLVDPARRPDGTWIASRDIFLGANVPGYDRCRGEG